MQNESPPYDPYAALFCAVALSFPMVLSAPVLAQTQGDTRTIATGDLGLIIERAKGSVILIDQSERAALARIDGWEICPTLRWSIARMSGLPMCLAVTAG